jgi:hypothetical protein
VAGRNVLIWPDHDGEQGRREFGGEGLIEGVAEGAEDGARRSRCGFSAIDDL